MPIGRLSSPNVCRAHGKWPRWGKSAFLRGLFGDGTMILDLNTLFLVTIYVEAILGLLLLFAWTQNTQIYGVAWWGCAHLMRAGSIALFGMYGSVSQTISIDAANALLFISYAVTWTGARVFDGRKPLPVPVMAGAAVWLVLSHLPGFIEMRDLRFLITSGIVTSYAWLTAYEFWRGRSEALVSRWPAIFLFFAHGSLFLLHTPLASALPWPSTTQVFDSVWLTVLSFETLLFTIAIAFILLAMAKERTEFRHRTAAMIDPLTGIANRRSFLHDATALIERSAPGAYATAVLLMDLDHFKSINDRFGHALGDRVLQIFAESVRDSLRPSDLLGRLGGEEFAVALDSVSRDEAVAIAERIHRDFVEASAYVDGHAVGATVSIGMVLDGDAKHDLPELLAQADRALYYAKGRGRDRVEIAGAERAPQHTREEDVAPSELVSAKSAA
jgi:diguanylate cyclase (GGDEF)-like protein